MKKTQNKKGGNPQNDEFIFFGCWNEIQCEKDYNYRDIILDYIREYESNVHTLFLAGDNWYANTLQEIQANTKVSYNYYLTSVLISGYHKILMIDKETHIVLGNHDIDTILEEHLDDEVLKLKENCMIKTQMNILRKIDLDTIDIPVPTLDELKSVELSSRIELSSKKIILYIDNFVVSNDTEKYNMICINSNKYYNQIESNFIKSLKELEDLIIKVKNNNKPIFVLGHHPISALTIKNNINKYNNISGNIKNIERIFELFYKYNIIYLCADTHNFQITSISKESSHEPSQKPSQEPSHEPSQEPSYEPHIVQIVSGTGGAKKDPSTIIDAKIDKCNFRIKGHCHDAYGYTKIKVNDDKNIQVSYISVFDDNNRDKVVMYEYVLSKNVNSQWDIKNTKINSTDIRTNFDKYKISNNTLCKQIEENNDEIKSQIIVNKDKTVYCYRKQKGNGCRRSK